jgi:anti-sigma B factor antagonist
MSELKITSQAYSNGISNIAISGFVDAYSYGQLEQFFNQLLEQKVYHMIVNLSQVPYLSSAGAGVFIGVSGIVQENGGDMVLVNPQPAVRDIFDLLGLTNIFKIANDTESALKLFGSSFSHF